MSKTPADRLKELRISKGYETAKDAAEAFGWSEVTYRAHEAGGRNITLAAARKYALAFRSTPNHILGLSGGNSQPVNSVILAPLVAKVSAGAFRYDEGLETEGIQVPTVPHNSVPAGVQYAVQIDGPSVNLRIPDGAFAICAPYDKYPGGPQHGQLVHVVRERAGLHEHTIKEIRYTRKGTMLMPCSSDPRYQEAIEMEAPEDDTTVRIQGVVIGSYQPL